MPDRWIQRAALNAARFPLIDISSLNPVYPTRLCTDYSDSDTNSGYESEMSKLSEAMSEMSIQD